LFFTAGIATKRMGFATGGFDAADQRFQLVGLTAGDAQGETLTGKALGYGPAGGIAGADDNSYRWSGHGDSYYWFFFGTHMIVSFFLELVKLSCGPIPRLRSRLCAGKSWISSPVHCPAPWLWSVIAGPCWFCVT